jgi:hypothetical protein
MDASDGLDVLMRLREHAITADIPVVVGDVDSLIAFAPRGPRALKRRLLDLRELARYYSPDAEWGGLLANQQSPGTTTITTRAGENVAVHAASVAEILPGVHVAPVPWHIQAVREIERLPRVVIGHRGDAADPQATCANATAVCSPSHECDGLAANSDDDEALASTTTPVVAGRDIRRGNDDISEDD